MPDPVPSPAPAPAPAANWYDTLPDPVKAHITNRGHNTEDAPTAAAKLAEAHYAAQRLIGVPAEQIVRLPKDANDPSYVDAYKRVAALGVPKTAEEYTFEGVAEEPAARARALAFKLGLPAHQATGLAAELVAADALAEAKAKATNDVNAAADQATLRAAWGANYDLNLFKANRVVEALGWDKATVDKMQATVGGNALLNGLLNLAGKMDEAVILRDSGGSRTPTLTRDQAVTRKTEIMMASSMRKFTPAELTEAQIELSKLNAIIVGGP